MSPVGDSQASALTHWATASTKGGRCSPSLEPSSRAWPVLCQAPGNLVMLAQAAHTCHLETASHLDFLHTRNRSTLLRSSSESLKCPTPPHLRAGREGAQAVRTQGPCIRLPRLTSHDFLSPATALSPSPIGQEKSHLFSGQEALLYLNRSSLQADCLPLGPSHPPALGRSSRV